MHANSVIPEARGTAARIEQEAAGYKASTIALAEGEASRFTAVLTEYSLAPVITRKRLYLETMESVFSRNKKVFLDVDSSGNILYLPLGSDSGSDSAPPIMPPMQTQARDRSGSQNSVPDPRAKAREGRR